MHLKALPGGGTSEEMLARGELFLGVPGGFSRPIRPIAVKSMLDRAKIGGTVIPKLSGNVLADILNKCYAVHTDSQALILEENGKISAIHSGDKRDYIRLPQSDLIRVIKEELNARFPGAQFVRGSMDLCYTQAEVSLPNQEKQLLSDYNRALVRLGRKPSNLHAAIRCSTSDTGYSSAVVTAVLLPNRGDAMPVGNAIEVKHRNKNSMETFTDALSGLYAQYEKKIESFSRLLAVPIMFPENALKAVVKHLKLPKFDASFAIADFLSHVPEYCTAHDCYFALTDIVEQVRIRGEKSERDIFELVENISRALTLDWKRFDTPLTVSW